MKSRKKKKVNILKITLNFVCFIVAFLILYLPLLLWVFLVLGLIEGFFLDMYLKDILPDINLSPQSMFWEGFVIYGLGLLADLGLSFLAYKIYRTFKRKWLFLTLYVLLSIAFFWISFYLIGGLATI